ncbi:MAG: DNA polymerase III subunit chi [Croceibacterium sp.]
MRVDFYLLSHGTVEAALPRIARAARDAGERMVVVAANAELRAVLDRALWEQLPEEFLAHGMADAPHAARQPVLLAETCDPANGAKFIALADGQWRDEALTYERAFLFFAPNMIDDARACWRRLAQRAEVEKHFWKQDGARWVEGP